MVQFQLNLIQATTQSPLNSRTSNVVCQLNETLHSELKTLFLARKSTASPKSTSQLRTLIFWPDFSATLTTSNSEPYVKCLDNSIEFNDFIHAVYHI